jgi:hypothetical protein
MTLGSDHGPNFPRHFRTFLIESFHTPDFRFPDARNREITNPLPPVRNGSDGSQKSWVSGLWPIRILGLGDYAHFSLQFSRSSFPRRLGSAATCPAGENGLDYFVTSRFVSLHDSAFDCSFLRVSEMILSCHMFF